MKIKINLGLKEFANLPIEQLNIDGANMISTRALGKLKRHNVDFVKDIFEKYKDVYGLTKIKGFGRTTCKNLESCIVNTYLQMYSKEAATKILQESMTVSEALDIYSWEGTLTKDGTIIWKSKGEEGLRQTDVDFSANGDN